MSHTALTVCTVVLHQQRPTPTRKHDPTLVESSSQQLTHTWNCASTALRSAVAMYSAPSCSLSSKMLSEGSSHTACAASAMLVSCSERFCDSVVYITCTS